MGFESFQVSLEGGEATPQQAADAILALENVTRDRDSELTHSSLCFLVRDARAAIELELAGQNPRVSCRFTLCHPPSVDAVFLSLVRILMDKLSMDATICDDVSPEHAESYSRKRFDEFAEACLHYIDVRRREWKATFGDQPLVATTSEAHQHIILPLCQGSVEKAS